MGIKTMKRYADDYETLVTKDEKGHEKKIAVYRGNYFEFALDVEGIVHFRRYCVLLLAAIVVLHISGGFVGNQGMYQFYVALPYVIAFFPLLFMTAGVLRLPKKKRKYRREEIGLSFDRMKTASIILMISLGIGVLGEITFLLFGSVGGQGVLEYLYLTLEALAAAAVYLLISLQRQIHVQVCSEQ
jgi:amino acid transporter